jgi:hypothetical protein
VECEFDCRENEDSKAMKNLRMGLHAVQDTYAHNDEPVHYLNYTDGRGIQKHIGYHLSSDKADDIGSETDPDPRLKLTQDVTIDYLDRFVQEVGGL